MLDMIKCSTGGAYYARGEWVPADGNAPAALAAKGFDAAAVENAKTGTMAYSILQAHNTSGDAENLKIKFDAMASHDITFVGSIQTARASGLEKFPIPYVLTNCHNSLCGCLLYTSPPTSSTAKEQNPLSLLISLASSSPERGSFFVESESFPSR